MVLNDDIKRMQEVLDLKKTVGKGEMVCACKYCGTLSVKKIDQRLVKCSKCGKTTIFVVISRKGEER